MNNDDDNEGIEDNDNKYDDHDEQIQPKTQQC